MLIVCPNCATSYDVDVATLRPNGRRVRCVRCRTVWLAELSHADKLAAAAAELAPVRRAVEAVAEVASAEFEPGRPPEPSEVVPRDEIEKSGDAQVVQEPGDDFPAAAESSDTGLRDEAFPDETPVAEAPEVDSPPTVPADLDGVEDAVMSDMDVHSASDDEPPENVESVAARRMTLRTASTRLLRWPLTQLQSLILVFIMLDAIIVGWRADFVRLMPQTASFYGMIGLPVNLRGLNFDGLTTSTEQHEGVPILVVEGAIVNDTRKMADVPHLRFAVRNAARQEIYSWNAAPPRPTLPPGEGVAFRTRLASPPPDAHDVLVRFLNRYDLTNGNR
ncbi:MAG TPA: MJ0042-type zinc finger domain-containing protein [Xanthobacteraceae bacterium]|jgi:predicted Zn finger-like uncharacterized protein|nr:MJ0042-type zinc finger domain-containing protein [Xanthobacteraceae bacterium]